MSLLRPRPRPEGSVWSVPPLAPDAWGRQPREVWRAVAEEARRLGYRERLLRAADVHGANTSDGEWFDFPIALTAAELGAPIGQLFTACLLRRRAGR